MLSSAAGAIHCAAAARGIKREYTLDTAAPLRPNVSRPAPNNACLNLIDAKDGKTKRVVVNSVYHNKKPQNPQDHILCIFGQFSTVFTSSVDLFMEPSDGKKLKGAKLL
jgi:hypothetical protein